MYIYIHLHDQACAETRLVWPIKSAGVIKTLNPLLQRAKTARIFQTLNALTKIIPFVLLGVGVGGGEPDRLNIDDCDNIDFTPRLPCR